MVSLRLFLFDEGLEVLHQTQRGRKAYLHIAMPVYAEWEPLDLIGQDLAISDHSTENFHARPMQVYLRGGCKFACALHTFRHGGPFFFHSAIAVRTAIAIT